MDSLWAGLDGGRKARRNFGKSFASTPITPLPQKLYTLHTTKTKKTSKQPRPEKQFPQNPLRRIDAGREAATRKMFFVPLPAHCKSCPWPSRNLKTLQKRPPGSFASYPRL